MLNLPICSTLSSVIVFKIQPKVEKIETHSFLTGGIYFIFFREKLLQIGLKLTLLNSNTAYTMAMNL